MISKNIFFKLNNDHFKIFFLLILLFIIFYRSPYILINGRFVAEEGSFWFRNAHLHGPFYALTQIFWGSSYLNLWSNIASFFSILVPIEYAPYVTVYFSLLNESFSSKVKVVNFLQQFQRSRNGNKK